jgi:hypothetical protein
MPAVDSSAIYRISHDQDRRELTIVFRGTGDYVYEGVPRQVYEAFLAAPSKGAFFNRQIRDRYRYRRLARARR